ncbi:hypothetical protein AKJ08_2083 [Vulgatibacter incomptus]|uniref:Uncharacterized protein n=1 Tax=Vulgatibacter incomptus TaxID=1391653 RepID=A0A0K1PE48_9BACT|nr:hypothetical protein AKJ08_2083 [Vulgatibacter incomptus]
MRAAAAIAFVLAGAIALVCAFAAFLVSPWGERRLAHEAERRISSAIAGEVRIGRLAPAGLGAIRIERVMIEDPEGNPVIAADTVELRVAVRDLLHRLLHVEKLVIVGGLVEVAGSPEGGTAIGRAFGPTQPHERRPAKGEPPLPPLPPIPIVLESLQLQDTAFRSAHTPGGMAETLVDRIGVEVSGWWNDVGTHVTLALRGSAHLPVSAPLDVRIGADFAHGILIAEPVSVELGTTRLRVRGVGDMRRLDATVHVDGVAGVEEAIAVGVPLAGDVRFDGDVAHQPGVVLINTRATVQDAGALRILGALRLPDTDFAARISFAGLDPSRWIRGGPDASLSGHATIDGGLRPLLLHTVARLEPGRVLGQDFGASHVDGELVAGPLVRVSSSEIALPGAQVALRGELSRSHVELQADVELRRIAATRPLVERLVGRRLYGIDGSGRASVRAVGPPENPEWDARLDLDALRSDLGDAQALALALHGRLGADGLPVLRATGCVGELEIPLGGNFDGGRLRASALGLSASRGEEGDFGVRVESAKAGLEGLEGALRIQATGVLRRSELRVAWKPIAFQGADLDLISRGDLAIEAGRARGQGEVAIGGVGLVRASYDGPVALAEAPGTSPIELDLVASPVDLASLATLVKWKLPAGRLRLRVRASGTLDAPGLGVDGRLTRLRIPIGVEHAPLDAWFHAASRDGFAELDVNVRGRSGELLELSAAAPVDLRRLRRAAGEEARAMLRSERFRISGEGRGIDLAMLGPMLGLPELEGAASARLDLHGPLDDPSGSVDLAFRGGPWGRQRRCGPRRRSGWAIGTRGSTSARRSTRRPRGRRPVAVRYASPSTWERRQANCSSGASRQRPPSSWPSTSARSTSRPRRPAPNARAPSPAGSAWRSAAR